MQGTHLAAIDSEMYTRKWERFHVRRPARIMAVSPCLSRISMRNCELLDISQGGAGIEMSTTIGLTQHYYLEVIGLARRIGCAEIYRNGSRVGVKFIAPIPEDMLHRIIRADFLEGDDIRQKRPGPTIGFPPGMGRAPRRDY
ncbi:MULTISPECIES: PilZ domain-containing protein [unclassified Ciceribacter]|uniref:PilZ domain-containing protein n=1 Tax=unclassified Ciceribacter TaxID=2628820 RepID=UPI001FEEEF90|nr:MULTISPECIES: PilZ domain-containing protein [unclassified Ciceribacter]